MKHLQGASSLKELSIMYTIEFLTRADLDVIASFSKLQKLSLSCYRYLNKDIQAMFMKFLNNHLHTFKHIECLELYTDLEEIPEILMKHCDGLRLRRLSLKTYSDI